MKTLNKYDSCLGLVGCPNGWSHAPSHCMCAILLFQNIEWGVFLFCFANPNHMSKHSHRHTHTFREQQGVSNWIYSKGSQHFAEKKWQQGAGGGGSKLSRRGSGQSLDAKRFFFLRCTNIFSRRLQLTIHPIRKGWLNQVKWRGVYTEVWATIEAHVCFYLVLSS